MRYLLLILLSGCTTYRDFTSDTTFLKPYTFVMDPLSSTLTTDDTSFIDELIFTSPLFDNKTQPDSAYIYKDSTYTYYIEYYFKSKKTITFFISKGYIRKNQLIKHHDLFRNNNKNKNNIRNY